MSAAWMSAARCRPLNVGHLDVGRLMSAAVPQQNAPMGHRMRHSLTATLFQIPNTGTWQLLKTFGLLTIPCLKCGFNLQAEAFQSLSCNVCVIVSTVQQSFPKFDELCAVARPPVPMLHAL